MRFVFVFLMLLFTFFFHFVVGESRESAVVEAAGEAAAVGVTVLSVASRRTSGVRRFLRSAQAHCVHVQLLGEGQPFHSFSQKASLLRTKLNEMINSGITEHIVIVTDSFDVIYLSDVPAIVRAFRALRDTRVLFGAEKNCWPAPQLAPLYGTKAASPFLNAGAFMGYLQELAIMVNFLPIQDDQLHYTLMYLNERLRNSLKISLDHDSVIFQNLYLSLAEVQVVVDARRDFPSINNEVTQRSPLVLHANGPSKPILDHLGAYFAQFWPEHDIMCPERQFALQSADLPMVLVAVFIEETTPFLEELLENIKSLEYPKFKIHLLLKNTVEYYEQQVKEFFRENARDYAFAQRIRPNDCVAGSEAWGTVTEELLNGCEYMLAVAGGSRLERFELRHLAALAARAPRLAPMLVRTGLVWSNFWDHIHIHSAGLDKSSAIRGKKSVGPTANCYLVNTAAVRSPVAVAGQCEARRGGHVHSHIDFCATFQETLVHWSGAWHARGFAANRPPRRDAQFAWGAPCLLRLAVRGHDAHFAHDTAQVLVYINLDHDTYDLV